MRRSDREMPKEFGIEVIDKSTYGTLGIDIEGKVYQIPLSLVRVGDFLYFHSAKEGTKVDAFKAEQNVSIVFVTDVVVPNLYSPSQIDELKSEGKIGDVLSKVYTTEFASAIVKGKISIVENEEEKKSALKAICEKYVSHMMELFDFAVSKSLNSVNIYKVSIDEITAKRKKFDSQGIEMKNGRME